MSDQKHTAALVVTLILGVLLTNQVLQYISYNNSHGLLSRQRRLIFLTSQRRLRLPPGTSLVLQFNLRLPFIRNLPTGYITAMSITINLNVGFDDLALTSADSPVGLGLSVFGRVKRGTKDASTVIDWSDGDRKLLYQVIEDTLHNMGMDGGACLRRAICELFQGPLDNHGFFGEVLELIFSASRSPNAKIRLKDYTVAERLGKTTGECDTYHHHCPYSLFGNTSDLHYDEHGSPREKRFIYITRERRITFPIGTVLQFTPLFFFPIKRGFKSGYDGGVLEIAIPLAVSMDAIGLTSPENPFGNFTFLDELFRTKREAEGVSVPEINWAGGDREIMYRVVENSLSNLGMQGKSCLLRAICEMFQNPLDHLYGVIGEVLELFLSASSAPYADLRMKEYVEAETLGKSTGDCSLYHESCPNSLFVSSIYQSPHTKDTDIPLTTTMDSRRRDDLL